MTDPRLLRRRGAAGGSLRGLLVVAAMLSLIGCGSSTTASSSSSSSSHHSPSTSSNSNGNTNTSGGSPGSGQLDPAVSMPTGFPSDFPVYPGARPTEQASLSSSGKTTYTVQWETLDAESTVQSWYSNQLKQGDWTVTFEASSSSGYAVTFSRKSDSNYGGIMSIDTTTNPGVTTIGVVLGG